MKYCAGDWTDLRKDAEDIVEVDSHYGRRETHRAYSDRMADAGKETEQAIRDALEQGRKFVLFRHRWSTSGPFRRLRGSLVRGFVRSKAATPYIERAKSIQHASVLLVAIRPRKRPECPALQPRAAVEVQC